ncbi:ATP-binding protein [Fibrella aquatilis]|uniref:histidine kinase n=1 Tax=Fibrella aquatilis TaxID=2817059 RepID=A0A939G4H1_9BACT|nr:ATP-binding protein [Fibrella aquatilis]MBO0930077.1 response regulator [Fibrella aquatilis]
MIRRFLNALLASTQRQLSGYCYFLLYCCHPLYGQVNDHLLGQLPHREIGVEQGLPQSFVSSIIEDDDGFIWIATLGGLARYDGQQMVPFYHQANNPASPLRNTIILLAKAGPNQLWLQYDSGEFDCFNTRTGQCTHLSKLTRALRGLPLRAVMHTDQQGNLWGSIAGRGIFQYDAHQQLVTRYRRAKNSLQSDTVQAITGDRQGNIWAVSPHGLDRLTPPNAQGRCTVQSTRLALQMTDSHTGTPIWSRVGAVLRTNGELMVNDRIGLRIIDPNHPTTVRTVPFGPYPTTVHPWLCRGGDGLEYVQLGTTLYQYTDRQGLRSVWQYQPLGGAAPKDILCTALCQARSGVVWLGGNTQGLHRIDLAAAPMQSFAYQTTFCADAVQMGLGLSLPKLFHWSFAVTTLPSSYLFRSSFDQAGQLYLGLGKELLMYDPRTQAVRRLPNMPTTVDSVDHAIRGISVTAQGTIWTVSGKGIPLRLDTLLNQWRFPARFIRKSSVAANDILADDGQLWISTTEHGLLHYDLTTQQYRFVRFNSGPNRMTETHLLTLTRDPTRANLLWIGSYNGLICFDKRTKRHRIFTTAQGLPNNVVYSVVADQQGYLWLSTNQGLCRFNPRTHNTLLLDVSDGLPGNEFNRFHHLRLPDGRLAFGGVKGWVLLDPAHIKPDTTKPAVALTSLAINNQPVDQFGPHSPLPQPLNTLPELRLTHDQNYLTIGFTALNYHQPDRVTYRYQLRNYDPDWTVSKLPTASYTKLPPGTYTFRVNAANSVGQWSHQLKELAVVIHPPFWATGWAYALYTLLLGSGLLGLVRLSTTRTRERHELALRQRQAEELRQLDQAKTRFFANVSHELRTPLTLVMGPLSSILSRKRIDTHDEQLIQTANQSAHQLLGLVNELLDLTKLEAGKLLLQPQPVRLSYFFQDCVQPFELQAQQLGITLRLDMAFDEALTVVVDAGKVRQVIQNLVANAVKFTPPGGIVDVTVDYTASQLRWRVRDTGRGIHPDDLPHVFERYFQTNQPNAPLEGGTGIGLALCQELVRLMQGSISVDSDWGKGSTFAIQVPADMLPDTPIQDPQPAPAWKATEGILLTHLARTAPVETAAHAGETVLVVEDNASLRTYLTTVLSPSLRVLTAAHGQAALTLLAGLPQPPALIIADIMMPVMDGFQLLEALKRHATYRTIPVMMLTARTDMADKLRALRLGVDDYLLKPFHEAELTARVTALLHNQRERQWQATVDMADPPPATAAMYVTAAQATRPAPMVSADDLAWLERLEELTEARLVHADLVADDLADALNMSRRTFYRAIKRLTGLTPAQYVSEARFRQARQLLETRQVSSVKQVAHRVGFLQVSHFSQQYQQRFGKGPAEYLQ